MRWKGVWALWLVASACGGSAFSPSLPRIGMSLPLSSAPGTEKTSLLAAPLAKSKLSKAGRREFGFPVQVERRRGGEDVLSAPKHRTLRRLMALAVALAVTYSLPSTAQAVQEELVHISSIDMRQTVAFLMGSSAFGLWAEKYTRIGGIVSGAMVTFFTSMLMSSFGLLSASTSHPAYTVVWAHLIPLAMCQMMLGLDREDIRTTMSTSTSMLKAFGVASIGTVVGAMVAFFCIGIPDAWKFAAVFTSTYVGGTMNFIATADAVRLRDPASLAAAFSADMIQMAAYFAILFYIGRKHQKKDGPREEASVAAKAKMEPAPSIEGFASCQAAGAAICLLAYQMARYVKAFDAGVPIATALSMLAAFTLPQKFRESWSSSSRLMGTLLLQVFFATIGATTDLRALFSFGAIAPLLLFVAVILAVHGATMALLGRRLLKIDVRDLLLASNAAIGGPATAAAMAGVMGWTEKISSAVLTGTIGYIIGTGIGMIVGLVCNLLTPPLY